MKGSRHSRVSNRALVVAVVLTLASVAGWAGTREVRDWPPLACLGAYRMRWFLLNASLSYAALWAWFIAFRRPTMAVWANVTAAHLGLLGFLAVGETVSLAFGIDFGRLFTALRGSVHGSASHEVPSMRMRGSAYPDLCHHLGAKADPIAFDFQADALGFRNTSTKLDPRVICLGDSILVAGLVPTSDIVTERLQAALGVQVMNCSRDGYDPPNEYHMLESTGLGVKGRCILQFVFEGNDFNGQQFVIAAASRSDRIPWPRRGLLHAALDLLSRTKSGVAERRCGTFESRDGSVTSVYFWYTGRSIQAAAQENLETMVQFLGEERDDVLRQGGRFGVVLVPAKCTVELAYVRLPPDSLLDPEADGDCGALTRLAAELRLRDIPHLDLRRDLRAAMDEGVLPYFAADTHLNSEGHRCMAEAVAAWMAREGQLR